MKILNYFLAVTLVFSLTWLTGCSRNAQDSGNKSTNKSSPNTKQTDSTRIYGTGYFDYRDSLESFHMGYSKPRDSIYKVENLKAFEELNLLIKSNPTKPGPYLDRGNHLQNIQKYKEAIADYDKYIEADQTNQSAYMNRGNAHERLKQYDLALMDYTKVIELKPNDTIAFFNRGVVYDAINNPWQAIREYDSCLIRDPRLAKTYYNRGATYERISDWKKSIADFEKAIQLNPQYKDELTQKLEYLKSK